MYNNTLKNNRKGINAEMRENVLARLGEILEESVQKQEISGGNLCVMYKGEEVYYAQAGMADIANQKKIERDSLFRLYSMTKPITAAAVMMLMEQGKIDLLDPIATYIPEFANMKVATEAQDVCANRQITVKDCLSMTSGLPYNCDPDASSKDVAKVFEELDKRLYSENPMTTVEWAKKIGGCRLAFQPGEGWRYGVSADVLGAVVEVASGMKFGEFLQQKFFLPLGMKDTGFSVSKEVLPRLVKVYEQTPDGLKEYDGNHLGICNHMDTKICYESGGAGLVSTIEDYQKFAQMLLQKGSYEGRQYLSVKTVEYFTNCHLLARQQEMMNSWENLQGFTYGNLMRIMTDTSLGVINGSLGEYGWDGWLGPYFSNIPKEDITFLMMLQKTDTGTCSLTRKLRNVLASAL